MPIVSTEIKMYRSSSTGSLGGARSSVEAGANVFDNVSSVEAAAGRVEYRCVYVRNEDPTLTLNGGVATIQSDTTSPTTSIAIGLGVSAVSGVEQTVASETTAPSGVTFGTSVTLGDIPALGHRAVWIRRTVGAVTQALQADNSTIRVSGSSTEAAA